MTVESSQNGKKLFEPQKSKLIERYYTTPGTDPLDEIVWVKRDSLITNKDGSVVFEMRDIEAPEFWSQLAIDIAASKYFRKAGLHGDPNLGETSVRQLVSRVAKTIRWAGQNYGYFSDEEANTFEAELTYILVHQIAAFNSPVWFNVGLYHQYGIEGQGGNWCWDNPASIPSYVVETQNAYERAQASACFITSVEDDLMDIYGLVSTEARLFKGGSGTGTNFSKIRGKQEKLSSGGKSSGLMSFLEVLDRAAGAIKSGGTCLAPNQCVYTELGPIPVKILAEADVPFITLSYDPPAKRYKAKWAKAWQAGHKNVVRIVTDKGQFEVTDDHPVKLSTGEFVLAGQLQAGYSLFSCSVDKPHDHLRVHLRNGLKGKEFWHRLIASDVMSWKIDGLAVHHKDENKFNNDPGNLEVKTHSEHAYDHGKEFAARGTHVFVQRTFPKPGEANGMHKSSMFWQDEQKVTAYRAIHGKNLKSSGRAEDMQQKAATQKMLNTAFHVLNAGYSIDTFDSYVAGRKKAIGLIPSITKLRKQIDDRFGTYDNFVREVAANNHRVIRVEQVGFMDVYDVEVQCPTLDDKSATSGHNFVIWPSNDLTGSGIAVANTRRAAKMVCLDMDHPEIVDFIQWKSKEEKKAKALIAQGYPSDFNDEAYHTVSGQNSNNSVRVTDEFIKLVEGDGEWRTTERTTGEVVKTYKARDLWRKIAQSAWECADPGVQYDTTINKWNTVKNTDRINGSNPCNEYMFVDNTACNLSSINLTKFYDGMFDVKKYRHVIRMMFLAQEILVDFSSYPTKEIAQRSHDFRPLGLGYSNLGALLMRMGLPYDSDNGRQVCSALTAILCGHAYIVSSEVAQRKGAFEGFKNNQKPMLDVMRMHEAAAQDIEYDLLGHAAREDWRHALELGEKHGYRNAQATVIAPVGTIGFLMDCDTTGIEPDFSLVKLKKLAGGGTMKIVNQSIEPALRRLGFHDLVQMKEIKNHIEEHGTIEGAPHLDPKYLPIFDCANRGGDGRRYLAPMSHLKMMAAAQPFLCGAISKTCSLPNETTVEDIERIYMEGWKLGLKGMALYRDGCKASQPLNSTKAKETESPLAQFSLEQLGKSLVGPDSKVPQKRKLPNRRRGITQKARVAGNKLFIRTGEYEDGTLGEIFLDMHKEGAAFRSLMNALAQAVSLGLQHGVPLETFVKQFTFTRFEPAGVVEGHPNIKMATSILDYIFRHLGIEYLKDFSLAHVKPEEVEQDIGTPSLPPSAPQNMSSDAPMCDQCGHLTVRNASCYRCLNCGNSMGCS